jgi:tetratricopeptide (TPR) repeat protein
LKASGIERESEIDSYKAKLNGLDHQFIRETTPPSKPVDRARALFSWLWKEKPARYKPKGNYLFNDVIDAQLNSDCQVVGNCLGLTLLFNCLLQGMGITAEALYLENAFGIGPHVLSILKTEDSSIDIENILSDGFDYKGHLNDPSRERWGDRELVADIYHSLGNEFSSKGEYAKALKNYEMALRLNPKYEKAHLNKAILLDKMEMDMKVN